ncbi:hypothetical protein DSO57_1024302 [Entomophthora muscae]|uniref:Uncharacterized protein n=1 Tax=Entomophthora muscae TaxID=34485 RepID=A0ACC2SFC8_9FUNG|nr:hypothetical protein DSO57_1024302 [Entomophthora muscae]
MYPVRGDKVPLMTLIPMSQFPPTQVAGLYSLVPSQQDILLALLDNLLHDVLLAQCSSSEGVALLFKLTPEHPMEGA